MVDIADVLSGHTEPATDRQLRYAANLGEPVRGDESRAEIAMKIELGEREAGYRERTPTADAIQSARYFGVWVMQGQTSAEIMHSISRSLLTPGREFDLARWYVFRICKHQSVCAWGSVNSPEHWLVLQIAQEVLGTPKIFESAQNEASRSGLVAFSSSRDDSGLNGSSNAPAYRFVLAQLKIIERER